MTYETVPLIVAVRSKNEEDGVQDGSAITHVAGRSWIDS